MTIEIVWLVIMVLLSGIFSGTEIAFVSSNKLKIELKNAQGDKVGTILSRFVKKTTRVITTILVGNNLALVIYGIFFSDLFVKICEKNAIILSDSATLALQTGISTLLILVFGEYFPKAIFRLKSETIMFNIFTVRILQFFYWIFGPFVIFINICSHFFLKKILRLKYAEEEVSFGKDDLYIYMQDMLSATTMSEDHPEIDAEMFTNAMEFNETRVKEFMVPRTEVHAISIESDIDALIEKFTETNHSKIIIYRNSLDEVLGFVHSSTLFRKPQNIEEVLQPILMVPENMAANVLLSEFSKHRKTIALVVDEFGGTEGLVTVEDLVEEVFGEIEDEHDEPEEDELLAKQIDENTWMVHARNEIDYLNEELNIGLPEGDYTTLAGMIIHHIERIPEADESVVIEQFVCTILDASENKINIVRIEKNSGLKG